MKPNIFVPKKCKTCKWFDGTRVDISIGFCNRHAPKIEGLPQVFSISWCGEHEDIKEEIK